MAPVARTTKRRREGIFFRSYFIPSAVATTVRRCRPAGRALLPLEARVCVGSSLHALDHVRGLLHRGDLLGSLLVEGDVELLLESHHDLDGAEGLGGSGAHRDAPRASPSSDGELWCLSREEASRHLAGLSHRVRHLILRSCCLAFGGSLCQSLRGVPRAPFVPPVPC